MKLAKSTEQFLEVFLGDSSSGVSHMYDKATCLNIIAGLNVYRAL